jgi:hypothetical protein
VYTVDRQGRQGAQTGVVKQGEAACNAWDVWIETAVCARVWGLCQRHTPIAGAYCVTASFMCVRTAVCASEIVNKTCELLMASLCTEASDVSCHAVPCCAVLCL